MIWDGDKNANNATPAHNHRMLQVLQMEEEDWPRHIGPTSACFENKLEDALKVEIGERAYEQSMNDAVRHYALTGNNRRKNALVMQRVVAEAFENGNGSAALTSIVERITQMRDNSQP